MIDDTPNAWLRKSLLLAKAMRLSGEFSEEECLEQDRRAQSFRNWLEGQAKARAREVAE